MPPTPLDGTYCNTLLPAHWSVCQKLNRVSSVLFSYVALYAPLGSLHSVRKYAHSKAGRHQPHSEDKIVNYRAINYLLCKWTTRIVRDIAM